jgi:mannosyltransferase OCH1-like enzyme
VNRINKITHTVWVGDQDMPDELVAYHKRKRKIMPKYTHLLWDNQLVADIFLDNEYKHGLSSFIRQSLKAGKTAHAADAIKLAAIDLLGGWALDADVEVLRNFQTIEAQTNFITGGEMYGTRFSLFTAVMGATPYHKFTQRLARYYYQHEPESIWRIPNTTWIHHIMRDDLGFPVVDQTHTHKLWDVTVLPSNVFCAGGNDAYAKHHFNGSWL